ncbi:MAG: hypothetical protein ACXWPP_22835, partial [Ktedonobacteraceae bacterium]
MSSQSSPSIEPEADSAHTTIGSLFLRVLVAISLIYYAALMIDLVLHPLALNIDETIADRYLEALTGNGVIIVWGIYMATGTWQSHRSSLDSLWCGSCRLFDTSGLWLTPTHLHRASPLRFLLRWSSSPGSARPGVELPNRSFLPALDITLGHA